MGLRSSTPLKTKWKRLSLKLCLMPTIVQYIALDSVVALNGSSWKVQCGRKDGLVSIADNSEACLPSHNLGLDDLVANFEAKGLTREQMVVLSRAHQSGVGHCPNLIRRLYTWSQENPTSDPLLAADYAAELKASCPQFTFNESIFLRMDVITQFFDENYYTTLKQCKGLFHSDQVLYSGQRTRPLVEFLTANNANFQAEFGWAMRAVGIKTEGQIRNVCSKVNEVYY
ncbi:hypothetical protein R1flu_020759 [Riccia fluitans]|uniref:Plant heme peroxidase family profile domain-containing protein n=1 Tax=Riccia fluitans TaxID=41844 RepID=A0ABD1ZP15_9MARC